MKIQVLAGLGLVLAALYAPVQAAPMIDLTGKGWTTYGDANVYSLPASGLEVMSGPGQISMYTKLGLGATGQQGNVPGMDSAFDTPNPNNVGGFRMGAGNEPGPTGTWDRTGWWDANLGALGGSLNFATQSTVFFFANNETGSGDTTNLAAWARIEVTRISTSELLGRYDLTNNGGGYGTPLASGLGAGAPLGGGVVLGDVTSYTSTGAAPGLSDFLRSGNTVCVYTAGPKTGLPTSCSAVDFPIASYEHNLGGDRAAYAVVFPELDALLGQIALSGNLADYALHVDYRLGCGPEGAFPEVGTGGNRRCDGVYALNGGDEKVFIGAQSLRIQQVPEPASLLLVAVALVAAGLFVRRSRAA
jgi:PEP-CTERM motif